MAKKSSGGSYRSAIPGRFVTAKHGKSSPRTTVRAGRARAGRLRRVLAQRDRARVDRRAEIGLAFECAGVAREIRARQWVALERADALVAAGDGAVLPPAEQGALARAILEFGWDSDPDEDEEP